MKKFYIAEALIIVAFIVGLFVGRSLNSEEDYYEDYYKKAAEAWQKAKKADTPPVSSEEPQRLNKVMSLYRKVFEKYRDSQYADDALFEMASRMDPTSEEAFALCRRLINNYPDSEWADDSLYIISMGYYQLGEYFSSKEDSEGINIKKANRYYDRALLHFNDLIERYSGSELIDEARLNRAMCYYRKGDLDNALTEFAKFQIDFPNSDLVNDVKFYTGMIRFDSQKYRDALTQFQSVVDSGYKELAPQAQFNIGQVYFTQGEYDKAKDAYQKTIDNFPESKSAEDAHFYLGWVYQRQKKYENAVEQLQEAIKKYPDNENVPNSHVFIAQIYYKAMGEIDKAIETYKKITTNKSYSYDMRRAAQYWVGKLYESEKQDIKQAIVEYEKLLKDFPELHIDPEHPSNDIVETYIEELKHKVEK